MAFPPAPSGTETKRPTAALCRQVKCQDLVGPGAVIPREAPLTGLYQTRFATCRWTGRIPGNMSVCPQALIPLHREVVRP